METRARYALIGLFTIAVVLSGFAFVYWIQKTGGIGERVAYRVRFEGPVSGLLVGSNVLFNGMRVGEVTSLSLDAREPGIVLATIAVNPSTPVRADTTLGMDFQGLTGAPVVVLTGGSADGPAPQSRDGQPPLLVAPADSGQTLTQSASRTLRRVDDVIAENAKPLHEAIENIETFTDVLSRNSDRINGILIGLERFTGGASGTPRLPIFTFTVPTDVTTCPAPADLQLVVPEPASLLGLSTNKIPVSGSPTDPHAFDDGVLADTVPALVQAKVIEALANSNCFRSVTRSLDALQADLQLAIDLRNFAIIPGPEAIADLDLSANVISSDGKNIGSTVIHERSKLKSASAADAAVALDDAFGNMIQKLTPWLTGIAASLGNGHSEQEPGAGSKLPREPEPTAP